MVLPVRLIENIDLETTEMYFYHLMNETLLAPIHLKYFSSSKILNSFIFPLPYTYTIC